MPKQVSIDVKKQILTLHNEGESYTTLAKQFKLDARIIKKIIGESGATEPKEEAIQQHQQENDSSKNTKRLNIARELDDLTTKQNELFDEAIEVLTAGLNNPSTKEMVKYKMYKSKIYTDDQVDNNVCEKLYEYLEENHLTHFDDIDMPYVADALRQVCEEAQAKGITDKKELIRYLVSCLNRLTLVNNDIAKREEEKQKLMIQIQVLNDKKAELQGEIDSARENHLAHVALYKKFRNTVQPIVQQATDYDIVHAKLQGSIAHKEEKIMENFTS